MTTQAQLISVATTTHGYLPDKFLDSLLDSYDGLPSSLFYGGNTVTTTCNRCGTTIYGESYPVFDRENQRRLEVCLDCLLFVEIPRHRRQGRGK